MTNIAHLTSVHPRYDTRIFRKECCSLVDAGYQVSLIVSDGKGDDIEKGISIYDVGVSRNRFERMWRYTQRVFDKAVKIDADIYHIHDPELIPIGLKLKYCFAKKVILDVHEDVSSQLLDKEYLSKYLRWFISRIYGKYEAYASRRYDAIIAATPHILKNFTNINKNVLNINNFPIANELYFKPSASRRSNEVAYVGAISVSRGIKEIIDSLEYLDDVKLNLAGDFRDKSLKEYVESNKDKVNEFGYIDREKYADMLSRSKAGMVIFHPLKNHMNAQPNKMFEYMSAGLPVVASNFPLWREIIEGNRCGICVNPLDSASIAEAIKYILANPEEADRMGDNGRRAVQEKYDWKYEAEKLIKLYEKIDKKSK